MHAKSVEIAMAVAQEQQFIQSNQQILLLSRKFDIYRDLFCAFQQKKCVGKVFAAIKNIILPCQMAKQSLRGCFFSLKIFAVLIRSKNSILLNISRVFVTAVYSFIPRSNTTAIWF